MGSRFSYQCWVESGAGLSKTQNPEMYSAPTPYILALAFELKKLEAVFDFGSSGFQIAV